MQDSENDVQLANSYAANYQAQYVSGLITKKERDISLIITANTFEMSEIWLESKLAK